MLIHLPSQVNMNEKEGKKAKLYKVLQFMA